MSHDTERRPSTGGKPPIKIREQYVVERVVRSDSTPCYTAWVREEIVQVPQGWSASDFDITINRPQQSFQIYDTTPQATDQTRLKNLAEIFHRETRGERDNGGRYRSDRIDVWGMPLAVDASEEQRIAKCKAHIMAEIAEREASAAKGFHVWELPADDSFHVSELRGHYQWNRAIIVIDQPEELWNKDEGGFLVVYWDLQPSYLEMLTQAYGEDYQPPETIAHRYTRDQFGQLLGNLGSYF